MPKELAQGFNSAWQSEEGNSQVLEKHQLLAIYGWNRLVNLLDETL